MKQGINIVLPPRDGVDAGALIIGEPEGSIRTADWLAVLGLDPLPNFRPEPTFKAVDFVVSDSINADVGASIAGRVLNSFGIGDGCLRSTFRKSGAKRLKFSLNGPAVFALQNIDGVLHTLRKAGCRPHPDYQDRLFFIVEKVWRARGLALKLEDEAGGQVSAVAEAKKHLQASAKLQITDRGDGSMTFAASKPLVFGLTLRELVFSATGIEDKPVGDHRTFRSAPTSAVLGADLFSDWAEA